MTVIVRGILGWGNRKGGLEAYGPGGRWGDRRNGDLLGDTLDKLGAGEGAELIVVAVPRSEHNRADDIENAVTAAVLAAMEAAG